MVSHGGLLNALLSTIFGLSPQRFGSGIAFYFNNTSYADLTYSAEAHKWDLQRFNDDRHLDGLDD